MGKRYVWVREGRWEVECGGGVWEREKSADGAGRGRIGARAPNKKILLSMRTI